LSAIIRHNPQGLQAAFDALKDKLEINENARQTAQVVRYADLGGSERGFPARSNKYSFQRKIDSMSSQVYLRRVNEDPQF